jgi:hypothetical protein
MGLQQPVEEQGAQKLPHPPDKVVDQGICPDHHIPSEKCGYNLIQEVMEIEGPNGFKARVKLAKIGFDHNEWSYSGYGQPKEPKTEEERFFRACNKHFNVYNMALHPEECKRAVHCSAKKFLKSEQLETTFPGTILNLSQPWKNWIDRKIKPLRQGYDPHSRQRARISYLILQYLLYAPVELPVRALFAAGCVITTPVLIFYVIFFLIKDKIFHSQYA